MEGGDAKKPDSQEKRRDAVRLLLSALPMYRDFDIVGRFDRIFRTSHWLKDSEEQWFAAAYYENEEIDIYTERSAEPETRSYVKYLGDAGGLPAGPFSMGISGGEGKGKYFKSYENLYNHLQRLLYDTGFLRSVYLPLYEGSTFYGLAFAPVSELEELWSSVRGLERVKEAAKDLREKIDKHLFPQLRSLYEVGFLRRMTEAIAECMTYEDFLKAYCQQVNFLGRCRICSLDDQLWSWNSNCEKRPIPLLYSFERTEGKSKAKEEWAQVSFNVDRDDLEFRNSSKISVGVSGNRHRDQGFFEQKSKAQLQQHFRLVQEQFRERMKMLDSARKAAVAAIMSRNMSHNIGSHVSPRATLDKIHERLGDYDAEKKFEIAAQLKARLDELIQKKADFLAEITTEPLATTKPAFFYREVILPFLENTLLTDNIARNEGIGYDDKEYAESKKKAVGSNALQISVKINGKPVSACYKVGDSRVCSVEDLPYSTCNSDGELLERHIDTEVPVDTEVPDVEVALPGPLGEYAFYGFLENFIRNVAKHHKPQLEKQKQKKLEIQINVADDEGNPEFYNVEVSTNLWKTNSPGFSIDDLEELYKKLEGVAESKGDENEKQPLLKLDLVKEDGSLRREAWGLAELKICANLLRGASDYSRTSLNKSLSLKKKKLESGEEKLFYQLRLMKSKQVCVVTRRMAPSAELRKQGIWVFPSVKKLKENLDDVDSIESYKFALINCAGDCPEAMSELGGQETEHEGLMPKLPFRVLLAAPPDTWPYASVQRLVDQRRVVILGEHGGQTIKEKLDALQDDGKPKAFLSWLWQQWIDHRFLKANGDQGDALLELYFEQANSEPTESWSMVAGNFNLGGGNLPMRVWRLKNKVNREITPTISSDNKDRDRHIVYDRHGGAFAKIKESRIHFDGMEDHTYMLLDKKSPDFTNIYSPTFPEREHRPHWSLPWELCEAGLLRIMIIDERVAEQSFEAADNKARQVWEAFGYANEHTPRRLEVAWASKVYICTHLGIDGGELVAIHDAVKKRDMMEGVDSSPTPPYLAVELSEHDKPHVQCSWQLCNGTRGEALDSIDMLIIHQGILDNFVSKKKEGQKEMLRKVRECIPFVIVDSGRGIPHTLCEDVKFIPFSLIQDYVMGDRIGKHSLTRIAMSLIRKQRPQSTS